MKMTCRLSTIYLDALTVWVSFTVYNYRFSETNNIVKPKSEVPKSRPKGLGLTPENYY